MEESGGGTVYNVVGRRDAQASPAESIAAGWQTEPRYVESEVARDEPFQGR